MSNKEFLKENSTEDQLTFVTKTMKLLKLNDALAAKVKKKIKLGRGNCNSQCIIITPHMLTEDILVIERLVEKVKKLKLSEFYLTPFWKIDDKKQINLCTKALLKEIEIIKPAIVLVFNKKLAAHINNNIKDDITVMPVEDLNRLHELEKELSSNHIEESLKDEIRGIQKSIIEDMKGFKPLLRKSTKGGNNNA